MSAGRTSLRTPVLAVHHVSVEVGAGTRIVDDVSLEAHAGELVALVGPNGAGKSTLLGVIAGDVATVGGTVCIGGRPLASMNVQEAARERAVLLQEQRLAFGFRARAVVDMGRTPWYRTPAEDRDEEIVDAAMARAEVTGLAERLYPSLSGGEKSRVSFARVLAQETPVLLLDEPTAALDIRHQEQVLEVARELAQAGCTIVVVLHDLSLAAAWADRICLLEKGRVAASGTPAEVITSEVLSRVYQYPVDVLEHDGRPVVVPKRTRAHRILTKEVAHAWAE
jgi:iron complex transport system ATP-binding protein